MLVAIGRDNNFGFGFTTSIETLFKCSGIVRYSAVYYLGIIMYKLPMLVYKLMFTPFPQLDLKALGEKVESVSREAEDLASRFPEGQEHLAEQRDEVVSSWRRLQEKASSKKSNLTQSEELQKFLNDFRDLM